MNKKGFTLVELLAVIIILSLLALLTSTAVTKLVKDAKDDLSAAQTQLIKEAADTWIADNLNKLPSSGSCGYLTLEDLKFYGVLDSTILDPKNSEEIPDDLKIKITTTTSTYGNPINEVEVNPKSIEGCSQIYYPVCTLATDSTITGLNAGAKYNCKVDPNRDPYTFFVLTTPDKNDTSVNLIMDSNITSTGNPIKDPNPTDKGEVAWYSESQNNSNGPITAMDYLQKATQNWTDANPQTINSFTNGSGEEFKMSKTYKTNARLPYYSEISDVSSTKIYLIDYLLGTNDSTLGITGRNNVSGIYGYWTLSSTGNSDIVAWVVYYDGRATHTAVASTGLYGVRPVINIPVNRIIKMNQ